MTIYYIQLLYKYNITIVTLYINRFIINDNGKQLFISTMKIQFT